MMVCLSSMYGRAPVHYTSKLDHPMPARPQGSQGMHALQHRARPRACDAASDSIPSAFVWLALAYSSKTECDSWGAAGAGPTVRGRSCWNLSNMYVLFAHVYLQGR